MVAIDLSSAATPKSDQLNADDLIGGSRVIRIRDVKLNPTGEQRCSIYFDGDNNKPWKPCKSMIRVLMHVWGADGSQYIGRSVELYRDDKVLWAGDAVGGIRIRALTNIDKPMTMSLTKTKGSKAPFTVQPLKGVDAPANKAPTGPSPEEKRRAAAEKVASAIVAELAAADDPAAVMTKSAESIERLRPNQKDLVERIEKALADRNAEITAINDANKE